MTKLWLLEWPTASKASFQKEKIPPGTFSKGKGTPSWFRSHPQFFFWQMKRKEYSPLRFFLLLVFADFERLTIDNKFWDCSTQVTPIWSSNFSGWLKRFRQWTVTVTPGGRLVQSRGIVCRIMTQIIHEQNSWDIIFPFLWKINCSVWENSRHFLNKLLLPFNQSSFLLKQIGLQLEQASDPPIFKWCPRKQDLKQSSWIWYQLF